MSPVLLDPVTVYVVAVIFLATLIRSTLGFGEALIAVPLLAFRLPVTIAAPLAVLVSVVVAGTIVVQDWRRIEFRAASRLVLSSLFGMPLGLLLLARAHDGVVKAVLGLIILSFSAYSLLRRHGRHLRDDHAGWLAGFGFLSGVLGGAYGMNGPPLAVYGAWRRWSPQHFRATLQGYFLPASVLGLLGYAWIGIWTREVTLYFLASLPAVAAAIAMGGAINRRMGGEGFLRVVHVGLVLTGAALLLHAAYGSFN
jgi:uncharacterized membrane protein YfcA